MFDSRLDGPPRAAAEFPAVVDLLSSGQQYDQLALVSSSEVGLNPEGPVALQADNNGEVFTRRWVVELILDLVGYTADQDLAGMVAVEPACGSGAFLVPMVERLLLSCAERGIAPLAAAPALRAFDLLAANVCLARAAVTSTLVAAGLSAMEAEVLAQQWIKQDDFLLRGLEAERADVVVGNPPYVRLEDVPERRSAAYRRECRTMGGRADIFVGFYEKGLQILKPGGRLGFICADRWMRNAYGASLRRLIATGYAVDAVLGMHDVDAFERRVSAYPAVTVLRNGRQNRTLVAETTSEFGKHESDQLLKWVSTGDDGTLDIEGLTASWLPVWHGTAGGWPAGPPRQVALVNRWEAAFPVIEETGVKIGIGVASGADDVYVVRDSDLVEPERMLPLVLSRDVRSGTIDYSGHLLTNPWTAEGLVDLADWPRLAQHFHRHREALHARSVARRSPGHEHRTIDRVIEGLATTPKLLLADLGGRICPVLDEGRYYPHHNLYWMTSSTWDLSVLGGLLLSRLAELFVATYCVRMRGGTLRFQAQYLRRIHLPQYADIPDEDAAALRHAFQSRDVELATATALRLYGLAALPT